MGAQSHSLELPASRRGWFVPAGLLVAATLAVGAVVGVNALRDGGSTEARPAAEFSAYQGVVTGTGPGLVQIAGGSFDEYMGSPITGTRPGLAEMWK